MKKFILVCLACLMVGISGIAMSAEDPPADPPGVICPDYYRAELVIPYFVTDGTWWTGVVLTNNHAEEANFVFKIHTSSDALVVKEYTVAAKSQEIFVLPFDGYAEVSVDCADCYCLVLLGNQTQLISMYPQFDVIVAPEEE
jgi:hypothetical protein